MGRLGEKRLFLLDMDGTVYVEDRLFAGVPEFLAAIRRRGGRYLFLSNNSSRGVEDYIAKMGRLGIDTRRADYLTSVDAAIDHLYRHGLPRLCYVQGTRSFAAQLRQAGIPVTDRVEEDVDMLLSGFDTELTFQKLEDACILLQRGVTWLATNPDWVCPTLYGSVPDCGSVCAMLTRATGREPLVLGKPKPAMVELAMVRTGYPPEQTLVVGDRIYTDIASGVHAGVDSAFVLSGEGTAADIETYGIRPTWTFADIAQLYHTWEGAQ